MNSVKVELSRELDFINLHTFADWHIGDKSCKMDEIREEIDAVKKDPNAYVILNGDLLNNATKNSVSDSYAEVLTPQEQVNTVTALLGPIADKILMICGGNHEARTYRESGIDLTAIVASNLGLLSRYVREGGVLFLGLGETTTTSQKGGPKRMQRYTVYATHGSGGGRKEGAKAIRLADMAAIVDCDLYLHSHTHLPMAIKEAFVRVDSHCFSTYIVDKLFVNTSAKLGYGGYGQTYEFKPSSTESPVVRLDGHKRAMKVVL